MYLAKLYFDTLATLFYFNFHANKALFEFKREWVMGVSSCLCVLSFYLLDPSVSCSDAEVESEETLEED